MKWIDLPPVWLALFMGLAWILARTLGPMAGDWARPLGWGLILAGLALAVAAVWQFARHKTTVVPHREPDAIITTGIFRLSRNPIYLGDALILAGWALLLKAPVALILVPAFMAVIARRFIGPEEARLARLFPRRWVEWSKGTRRWL